MESLPEEEVIMSESPEEGADSRLRWVEREQARAAEQAHDAAAAARDGGKKGKGKGRSKSSKKGKGSKPAGSPGKAKRSWWRRSSRP